MKKSNFQRMIFLFLAAFLLLIAAANEPEIYGNDEASIRRYIYQESGLWMQTQGELLAVEDRNDDRIVFFRPDDKKPDELWFVRFRKNQDGNYEGYAPSSPWRIHHSSSGKIWSQLIDGWSEDPIGYYAIWSEHPSLHEVAFRLNHGPEQRIQVTETPSLIIFEFQQNIQSWNHYHTAYYDASGTEIR